MAEIHVQNNGSSNIYVHIYALENDYEVVNTLQATFEVAAPSRRQDGTR